MQFCLWEIDSFLMIMNILYEIGFYKGFLHDVNSFVAKYRGLISQEQIHLGEIHIFTPFL